MRLAGVHSIFLISVLLLTPRMVGASETKLQFWSSLTPFEANVVEHSDALQSGDPHALLALALIASGDVRKRQDHDRIKARIQKFIEQIRPRIDRQASTYDKGKRLLKAMHSTFFKGGKDDSGPELISGYDSEQSKVSTIFKSGRFNCISSAILYAVLARYFDLKVQGVIMYQHAFIQITDENGRIIEVETTSKNGYGLVHDKTFFKERFSRFSKSRNLAVPTYKAYLNRRVVLPYILISENMKNQHTAPARMTPNDRHRLSEIMGYLDGNSVSAQLTRLNAFHNECIALLNHRNMEDIIHMRRVITAVVHHVKSRPWIDHTRNKDIAAVWTRISAVHLMLGSALQSENAYDPALQHFTEAVHWARTPALKRRAQKNLYNLKAHQAFNTNALETAIEYYKKLLSIADDSDREQAEHARQSIAAAYWNMANTAGKQDRWEMSAAHYASAAKWAKDPRMVRQSKAAEARAHAMGHYKRKAWEIAIRYFKQELSFQDRETLEIGRRNIGAAYTHWGNDLFKAQAYDKALDKYEAALEMMEPQNKSALYNNIAVAYHNLTVPLLNKKQIDEAMTVWKSGLRRFPDCTACQKKFKNIEQKTQRLRR